MKLNKLFLMLTFLVLLGTTAFAQIYVSPSGNDNNDGTSANPKATIQAGINAASAGQTVYIAGGFYDETVTLNKRVNLAYWTGTQAVSVTALVLDAGDNFSSNSSQTDATNRAYIFHSATNDLVVLSSLTVKSGYYVLNSTSNLKFNSGVSVVWSASTGTDKRFTKNDNTTAEPLVLVSGSYNLTFSNTSTQAGTYLASQLPSGINNLTFSNTASLTIPNSPEFTAVNGNVTFSNSGSVTFNAAAATITGTVTLNGTGTVTLGDDIIMNGAVTISSGSKLAVASSKLLTVNNNLTNNGTLDGPGTVTLSGAPSSGVNKKLAGSGTFNADITLASNPQDLGSNVTLKGNLTVNNVTLDLKGYTLTLNKDVTYSGASASITTGTSGAVVMSGDNNQTIYLGDADRSIANLTVNKGPASFLYLKPGTASSNSTGDRTLTVGTNFNFQAGRIELSDDSQGDAILQFSAGTIRGILTRNSTSAATLTVDNTNTTSAKTIAGNGQINLPVTKTGPGEVIFSELTQIGDVTVNAGTLTFGVALTTGTITNSGTIKFNGGTVNTGAITNNPSSTITFATASTIGSISSNAGTITFNAAATVGGNVTNAGTLDFKAASTISGTVTNSGTMTVEAGSVINGAVSNSAGAINFKGVTINNALSLTGGTVNFKSATDGGLRTSKVTGNVTGTGIVIEGDNANNNHTVEFNGTLPTGSVTVNNYAGIKVTKDFNTASIAAITNPARLYVGGSSNLTLTVAQSGDNINISTVEFMNTARVNIVYNATGDQLTVTDVLKLTSGTVASGDGTPVVLYVGATAKVYRTEGRLESTDGTGFDPITLSGPASELHYQNTSDVTSGPELGIAYSTLYVEGSGKVTLATGITPSVSKIVVKSGSELANNGNNITVNGGVAEPIDVDGVISGTGSVNYTANSATESIKGSGSISKISINITNNTYTVNIAGALNLGPTTATVNGTLNFNAAATLASLNVSGSGTVNFNANGPSSIAGDVTFGVTAVNINKTLTIDGKYTHTTGTVTLGVGNFSLIIKGTPVSLTAPNNYVFNGTGRFVLGGTSAQTLTLSTDAIINRVEINNPAGIAQTGGYILYTNDLLLTAGVYNHGGLLNARQGGNGRITVVAGSLQGAFTAGTEPTEVIYQNPTSITAGTELSGSVDKLTVASADTANVTLSSPVTINTLLLAQSGTLVAGSNITMANGSQITVASGSITGSLSYPTSSGQGVNIRYVNTSDISTGAEMSASGRILNLILDASSGKVVKLSNNAVIYGDLTINSGTLNVDDKILEIQGNVTAGTITSNGGGFKFTGNADKTVDGSYTYLPAIEIAKSQSSGNYATLTIQRTGTAAAITIGGAFTQTSGNVAFGTNISNVTVNGDFTVASTARQFNGYNLTFYVKGNYSAAPNTLNTGESASATVPAMINMGTFVFNGTTTQTISHAQGGSSAPTITNYDFNNFEVNNANGVLLQSNVVVAGTATLRTGIVTTGNNALQITNTSASSLVRIGGMVNGTLKRAVAAITAGSWEFPLTDGTNLRQLTVTAAANTFANATNITVKHNNVRAEGTAGFPVKQGSTTVSNMADMNWVVSMDNAPSAGADPRFTLYAQGLTGFDDISGLRIISRAGVDETGNPWTFAGTYVNSLYSGGVPMVIHDGVGGWSIIQTQQFAIGFSGNRAPVLSHPSDITVNETDTVNITWTVSDPDIGQTPNVAIIQKPAAATFNATTKTLTWVTTYQDAGTHTVILSATDGTVIVYDTVLVVVNNVNRAPSFTATGASTKPTASVKNTEVFTFTYTAVDPDGDALTYSVASVSPAPAGTYNISASLGTLTFTPAIADAGKDFTFTIQAADPNNATATTTTVVTVTHTLAKGDLNGSGLPDATDASNILKHVVGLAPITDQEQLYAADVNGDGEVGAYDAAWILYYVANGSFPTAKISAAMGNVEFERASSEKGVISLPLTLKKTSGVVSVYTEVQLTDAVEFKGVSTSLPEGWVAYSNFANGVLKIAMAGTTPLKDGNVALINLALKDKEAQVNLNASAKLNDQSFGMMSVKVKEIPAEFSISQNYPNPFNPTTSIKYAIPQDARVSLVVYDMLGQVVKTLVDQEQEAGYYTVRWDGTNDFGSKVSSGIYIYRIIAGKYTSTMKMNLLK